MDMVEREKVIKLLKDAINEICYKCGKYKTDYLGSCDDCGWAEVKESDLWNDK